MRPGESELLAGSPPLRTATPHPRILTTHIHTRTLPVIVAGAQSRQADLPADAAYRVAEVIRDLRLKAIAAIKARFDAKQDITLEVAKQIIAELGRNYETHIKHVKKARLT